MAAESYMTTEIDGAIIRRRYNKLLDAATACGAGILDREYVAVNFCQDYNDLWPDQRYEILAYFGDNEPK